MTTLLSLFSRSIVTQESDVFPMPCGASGLGEMEGIWPVDFTAGVMWARQVMNILRQNTLSRVDKGACMFDGWCTDVSGVGVPEHTLFAQVVLSRGGGFHAISVLDFCRVPSFECRVLPAGSGCLAEYNGLARHMLPTQLSRYLHFVHASPTPT